jgi:hypothetical protein
MAEVKKAKRVGGISFPSTLKGTFPLHVFVERLRGTVLSRQQSAITDAELAAVLCGEKEHTCTCNAGFVFCQAEWRDIDLIINLNRTT